MPASILDGHHVASLQMHSLKEKIQASVGDYQAPPGLAVILLGDDHASSIYVKRKAAACEFVGFNSTVHHLPDNTTQAALLSRIDALNADNNVHGILVQLPLPKHIDTETILSQINPSKDVDGFHPENMGHLAQGHPKLRPCTPLGIIRLLNYYKLPITGKHATIVGASNIVGRPMALEFLLTKATVTICHSETASLEKHVRMADIVVVATGIPDIISVDWCHEEQILIDVGMHRNDDNSLRGEIDFHAAKEKVAWITPVPGGVGPMTIATLLDNTFLAWSNAERNAH